MNSAVRRWVIIACACALAVAAGWEIGQESLALPAAIAVFCLLLALNLWLDILPDALVGGAVVVGYLIGNRGFAQLSPSHLPLLPGETALGLGLVCCIWRGARTKVLPIRRDWVNWLLVLLILTGAIRIPLDIRRYGIMAIRDFATIYYALFFFIAQDWARHPKSRQWIEACFTVGFAFVLPSYAAFERWPDFIVEHFTLNGAPVIYVKGDIACGFMVAALFWFLDAFIRHRRLYQALLALINFAGVLLSNSRAAIVALFFCIAYLLLVRVTFKAGRLLRWLVAFSAIGLAFLLAEALLPRDPGKTSQLYRFYENARTVTDMSGTYVPETVTLSDKADNNSFRMIWWREVINETWAGGPWFGLGFGHDLAERFVMIYYPDETEEFGVRSPHSILVSIFARMGVFGFVITLALLAGMAARTWRDTCVRPAHEPNPAWLGAWAIFITACFGVVLEGPMGAIVFWILLGLANSYTHQIESPNSATESAAKDGNTRSE
jgi:O-antigen ligase